MDQHSHYHHPQHNDLADSQMTTHFKVKYVNIVIIKLSMNSFVALRSRLKNKLYKFYLQDIVDPRLVLLKLGLDNELDVTNDCLGTMQSITE